MNGTACPAWCDGAHAHTAGSHVKTFGQGVSVRQRISPDSPPGTPAPIGVFFLPSIRAHITPEEAARQGLALMAASVAVQSGMADWATTYPPSKS